MKDSLDIDVLSNHLDHLQNRLKELKEDMLTKYIPIENTANVEGDMNHALQKRNMAEKNNETLKYWYKGPFYNMRLLIWSIFSLFFIF